MMSKQKSYIDNVSLSCGIDLYNPNQICQYLSQYKISGDISATIKDLKSLKSAAIANQNKNDNDDE